MTNGGFPSLYRATSIEDALDELERLGEEGEALAGGTWIMLAPLRRQALKRRYVALKDIEELQTLEVGNPTVLGALTTHTQLGRLAHDTGPLGALAEAARRCSSPAIGNVATLAGNTRAAPYPEADLVPALLAADAVLELVSLGGRERIDLASYLASRTARPAAELISSVSVPAPPDRYSWYERLTVRGSGEEAVVSVAVSLDLAEDGVVSGACVAIGSVHEVAFRSGVTEAALQGRQVDAAAAEEAGRAAAAEMTARDDVHAPGWYRLAVLPALLRRAVARITESRAV